MTRELIRAMREQRRHGLVRFLGAETAVVAVQRPLGREPDREQVADLEIALLLPRLLVVVILLVGGVLLTDDLSVGTPVS